MDRPVWTDQCDDLSRLIGDGVAGSPKLNISAKSGISWSSSIRACLVLSFSFQLGVGGGVFRGVLVVECRLGIFTTEGMDWCVLGVTMGMNLRCLWLSSSCFRRRYTSWDEQFQLHP
jgi:hypothetical protein